MWNKKKKKEKKRTEKTRVKSERYLKQKTQQKSFNDKGARYLNNQINDTR